MTSLSKISQLFQSRAALVLPALAVSVALSGCAGFVQTASPTPSAGIAISGNVHGGQQPVTGSHVYLYSVGTTGYGSAGTSLLIPATSGVIIPGSTVTADGSGNGYVTTDTNGNFNISGDYSTCASSPAQTYLLAVGGNPGLGGSISNSAITMIAALGPCSGLASGLTINVDEISTVAAVTALQAFMVDSTHIGSSSSNLAGITNAFLSVSNIASLALGTARTTNILGNGAVPQSKLNTLADILAPCVNTSGPTSSACVSLFTDAKPSGGTAPSDISVAMLDIAQNPVNNVSALFGLMSAQPPFLPALSAAPNDYTIGITYTGGGLTNPGLIAIDANGAAWTANCPRCLTGSGTDSVVGIGPQGAVLSGTSGYTSGIHLPQSIALDTSGNIWTTDLNNGTSPDQVTRMSSAGVVTTGFPYASSSLSTPLGLALDNTGTRAYVTNQGNNSVVILTPGSSPYFATATGTFSSPAGIGYDTNSNVFVANAGSGSIAKFVANTYTVTNTYTGGGLSAPQGIAIDASHNIWTINQSNAISIINGNTGVAVSPSSGFYASLNQAAIIAIDGASTAWIANCNQLCGGTGSDYLIHVNAAGTNVSGVFGFQDTHFSRIGATAIDASGNVWVSSNAISGLTEMLGIAAPVSTPLNPAVGNLGVRP